MTTDSAGIPWTRGEDAASLDETRKAGFDVLPSHHELFISHRDWMRRTHLTIGVRSPELKRLDDVILRAERIAFDITNLEDEMFGLSARGYRVGSPEKIRESMEREAYRIVRSAFEAWAKSEGKWEGCRRDHDFAPTQVFLRLLDLQEKYPDLVADIKDLASMASEVTTPLFKGAKVKVRGADLSNVVQSTSQASSVASVMGQLGSARPAFEQLIQPHFGVSLDQMAQDPTWAKELMKVLPSLTNQIHELVQLIPGLGVAASAVSAIGRLYDVHTTDRNRMQLLQVSASIPKGDARTALGVIKSWQDRYIIDQKMAAAMDATSAGVNLVAILIPAGQPVATIFGAAKSVAQMMNVVVDLGVQYRESQALEKYLLNVEAIDADIFAISPLVGAYYVLNVPFSFYSLHLVPYESPTFLADTEWLRESGEMKAVLSDAERLLNGSKYELISAQGLPYRSRESMSFANQARLKANQIQKNWFS